MSGEARVFAHGWRPARSRGAPTLRLAILELAERADHAGYVTACRVGDLADAIARDERTVPRVTAELVRAGVLSIQRRVLRGRGQVANVYRVLTDQIRRELAAPRLTHRADPREVCGRCHRRLLDHTRDATGELVCPPT